MSQLHISIIRKRDVGMLKKVTAVVIPLLFSIVLVFIGTFLGCIKSGGTKSNPDTKEKIVVGFSQLGAESDWRSSNTESMKEALSSQNGFTLIFEDGQQKQANQITAIRMFIQQEVDYIVLAPVIESGWDTVLQEAKNAGIPVIIVDRMVDVEDEDLFTCWVGSNFELEGKKAVEWLNRYVTLKNVQAKDIHIVNIQGNRGASAQLGRTKALADAVEKYGWDLLAEVPADFTQAKAREVMDDLLAVYDNINVVYCENDNEAFGAIEAIEAAGKKVGMDIVGGEIMVMSFDGVNQEALAYVSENKIACIAESNPLHGPRVQAIIELLEAGKMPDKFSYVQEKLFASDTTVTQVVVDGVNYEVTLLESTKVSTEATEEVTE